MLSALGFLCMSVHKGLKNVVMLQEDGATCGSFVFVKG